ncbi:hypothetical protein DSM43518_02005 [Mycobacterium marinum]|nr:hypothetical protein DSM43518_02005 [Mycobacterium marinum]
MGIEAGDLTTHARIERELKAITMVLDRAEIPAEALETTRDVLRKLAVVDLDDLCVPPGFNLLASGEVASANRATPEWQFYQSAQGFIDDANHLECTLFRAHLREKVGGVRDGGSSAP